ncbi:MAG: hypothetical protein LBB25_01610 [Holosporaceae bacterium]|jgi:hypothetical protein|nr:hypothetical protein [Holosporaceae bacterium]
MKSLKNNVLVLQDKKQLCKMHNGKNHSSQKIKLLMYKSYNHAKTYHPLKRKKIKLHKLKFVPDIVSRDSIRNVKSSEMIENNVLSKRYSVNRDRLSKQNNWSSKEEIINWLTSIDIKIKRINTFQFLLKNKIYSFNYIAIFANKKRLELGLSPFYIEGITEY